MWSQDRSARTTDTSPTAHRRETDGSQATPGGDDSAPIGQLLRPWALRALIAAYGGDTFALLTDLADLLETSLAYVDRPTVEAHLERPLSDDEWSGVAAQFTAMAFDEHVGDAGTVRTDWIDDTLHRAGVPGRTFPAAGRTGPSRPPRRR
jgi:hypothetical protein